MPVVTPADGLVARAVAQSGRKLHKINAASNVVDNLSVEGVDK
jgi:hypothetical protein